MTVGQFKKTIVQSRLKMLEQLYEAIKFFAEHDLKKEIDDKTESSENKDINELKEQIKKRDDLLTEIGPRINRIFEKLCQR